MTLQAPKLTIALVLTISTAHAGIQITQDDKHPQQSCETRIFIDHAFIKSEGKCTSHSSSVVFDRAKGAAIMIDHTKKSYTEISKAAIEELRKDPKFEQTMDKNKAAMGKVGNLSDEYKKAMAKMPPEQRAMVEKMMEKNRAPTTVDWNARPTYKKTSGQQTIAGHKCQKFTEYLGTRKMADVCGSPLPQFPKLGDYRPTMEAFKSLMVEWAKFMSEASGIPYSPSTFDEMEKVGVMLERVPVQKGMGMPTTKVKSITEQNFAASEFAIPAGYKRESMSAKFER